MTTHQQTAAALAERWKEREEFFLKHGREWEVEADVVSACRRELCAAFGLDSGSLPLATRPPSEAASTLRNPSEEPTK